MRPAVALWAFLPGVVFAQNAPLTSFQLADLSGVSHEFPTAKPTVVLFYSTVCPISNEYNERITTLYREFSPRVQILLANANQNETAAQIRDHVKAAGFEFPVYQDRNNTLADRLHASLTPEAFLLDSHGVIRYHGPIDDARNPARVKTQLLRDAISAVLANKPVTRPEAKSFGCTIKRVGKS